MRLFPSLFAFLLGAGLNLAPAAETPATTVAIFDFQSTADVPRDTAIKVSSLLGVDLSADPHFLLVERGELEKAIQEQELNLSSAVSDASAVKVGQFTGAQLLITGRLMKLDRDTVLLAKVIGTDTSRVFIQKVVMPPSEGLSAATDDLAKKLSSLATDNRTALLGKSEDPSALIEQLKTALAGKKLPTIAVTIPEQHFGQPVIDPAAETELNLIFQQCGFEVVDAKSNTKPDVEVTGEAFSERGWQKGNLIACKARLELKIRRVSDGTVLAVDRQQGVGIDLGEHIAAKAALQNAARRIAERVVPLAVR